MAVEVYPLRLTDAPLEVWYGVKANGQDLRAGWADPEAARRAGERHLREIRERISGRATKGGETMETTERKTETTETEKTVEPVVVPAEDPKLPDDDGDENDDDDAKS